jgi:energy-coupling factor transporter transmembrane protein EcfT
MRTGGCLGTILVSLLILLVGKLVFGSLKIPLIILGSFFGLIILLIILIILLKFHNLKSFRNKINKFRK